MSGLTRRLAGGVAALVAATSLIAGGGVGPASAAPAPTAASGVVPAAAGDTMTFSGHGWGHGRGMGQYGALGFAVDYGWNYQQILDRYYGGTTLGNVGAREVTVELTALNSTQLVAIGRDLRVNGAAVGSGDVAIAAQVQTDGSVLLSTSTGCSGPWTPLAGTYSAGALEIGTASQASYEQLIRVCEAGGTRSYRGTLSVQQVGGAQMTFNRLSSEDYLLGVVPRESPASWGSLGGGRGQQALMAQAVAARSYALSGSRPSGATTCDTTTCQVYSGAAYQPAGGALSVLEATSTNQAVASTGGQVRLSGSTIARTEFSSSTGGWTAGGTFPAVVDEGDATSSNPNHNWTTPISVATASAQLGVGTLSSLVVTQRNGLGVDGGRVLSVQVTGSAGSRSMTGAQVRTALGLKSDWFTVSWTSPAEAQSLVNALYQDLLGRGPDPTGLAGWTAALLTGTGQPALVDALTHSDEYIQRRVAQAYREVLGREPEAAGAQDWWTAIRNGYATVDDVQRRFYDSDEYFTKSGNTWDGYVRRLYTTMLGREAGDAEVATWVSLVASQGRAWVVDSIWWSHEAAAKRAGAYYQTFLGREPDPQGQADWAVVLLVHGEGAVRVGIAGSLEYRARAIARFP